MDVTQSPIWMLTTSDETSPSVMADEEPHSADAVVPPANVATHFISTVGSSQGGIP